MLVQGKVRISLNGKPLDKSRFGGQGFVRVSAMPEGLGLRAVSRFMEYTTCTTVLHSRLSSTTGDFGGTEHYRTDHYVLYYMLEWCSNLLQNTV